jgi:hypothetical protein
MKKHTFRPFIIYAFVVICLATLSHFAKADSAITHEALENYLLKHRISCEITAIQTQENVSFNGKSYQFNSVLCTNQKAYAIYTENITPQRTWVVNCDALRQKTALSCFKKI